MINLRTIIEKTLSQELKSDNAKISKKNKKDHAEEVDFLEAPKAAPKKLT